MTPNSAYHLLNIKESEDYASDSTEAPVFAIHCTRTNSKPLKMISIADDGEIEFPPNSFVQGAIYWIYVKKITDLGGASFIGYKYPTKPFHL